MCTKLYRGSTLLHPVLHSDRVEALVKMIRNRTRHGRGNFIKEAETNLENLKHEAINDGRGIEYVSLHETLSSLGSKYSREAIADIIPDIITVLNKLDAALKVNEDLNQAFTDLSNENKLLLNTLESEKCKRKQVFEDSLTVKKKQMNKLSFSGCKLKILRGKNLS